MDENILAQEKQHLEDVKKELKDARKALDKNMASMGDANLAKLKRLREDTETDPHDLYFFMEQLHNQNTAFNFKDKYKRLEELDFLANEPYFSRIDLFDKESNEEQAHYIGKFGYTHNNNPLITDWRAKVASIFYRYRYPQKNVKYETPAGTETRDLKLKRTFDIDEGVLIKYYNNDLKLDETEIIQDKIEQRTGGVLEDIVETIQEGQLDIIESDPRQICIVQGCVGSGKSTVAIHKLSHIFFNFPKLIKPERAILVAKNQILIGYLSTLFPKLGIFSINYGTLKDILIKIFFRDELDVEIDLSKNNDVSHFTLNKIKDLKRSINEIHLNFEQKIDFIFEKEEFVSFGGFVYDDTHTVLENFEEVIEELSEELKYQIEAYENASSLNPTRKLQHKYNIKALKAILKKLRAQKSSIKGRILPNLLKKFKIDTSQKLGYLEALIYVYIYSQLFGFKNFQKYQYCVIDEGQDFSVLEYLILGTVVINGRFCILGDLNQSYEIEGLSKWEQISTVVEDASEATTFELNTNYRSTKPIIDLANKILSPFTSEFLPKSINRKGPEPEIVKLNSKVELLQEFKKSLGEEVADLQKSIGVIIYDNSLYDGAKKIINELNIEKDHFIELDSTQRVHYIPRGVYLTDFSNCKGLEFAKVYILGLNLGAVTDFTEAKRAFVAVTRAMNEVHILDSKEELLIEDAE